MGPGEIAGIVIGGFVLLLAATYGLNKATATSSSSEVEIPDPTFTPKQRAMLGLDEPISRESSSDDNTLQWGGYRYAYTEPCTLPGFEWVGDWFNQTYLPQGIVLSSSILFYYLWFLINTDRPQIIPGLSIGIILVGQAFSLSSAGCFGGDAWGIIFTKVFFACAFGAVIAGIGYAIVKNTDYRPFSSFSEQFTTFSAKKENNSTPAKKMVVDVFGPPPAASAVSGDSACTPSGNGKCLPANDEDQFVCEAYRDGQLVTSTIVS